MSDWWEERSKPKRRWPYVLGAFVGLAGAGAAAWSVRPKPNALPPPVVVIEEPATLGPLVLSEPTPKLDEIFGTRMMNFTIGLDHGDPNEDALRQPDVKEALGDRAFGELGALLDAAKHVKGAPADDDDAVTAFDIATAKLDNALLAGKFPYFVDTNVIVNLDRGSKIILMYEFHVASFGLYASNAAKVRSVRLRRLDRLNWEHTLLGFVNPHRPYAAVLLDQVDDLLVRHLLPGLANDAPLGLIAFDETPTPASKAIAARGGEIAREELGTIVSRAEATELGEALRARRDLFAKWRNEMKLPVKPAHKLSLDVAAFDKEMSDTIPQTELELLKPVQERLDKPALNATYEKLRDAYVDSIERHEVQHRLDVLRPIPMPPAIDALVPPNASKVAERKRWRMQAELSAYLTQIGRDEAMARTTYTLLLRFLVDPRTRNSAEATAALVVTEELAKELGVADVAPLVRDGHLDETRIVRGHTGICAVGTARVAEAARKAWSRVFGAPFAPLVRL